MEEKYEFSGNAPTAFQRLRVNAYDLLSDPSVFPASGTGDIFWEGFQVQTPQSGGKMLYFCYERNAAYAAASSVVFRTLLSLGNEYWKL